MNGQQTLGQRWAAWRPSKGGLVGACLAGFWLSSFYLVEFPLTATDFSQYCQSVASLRDGSPVGASGRAVRLR